MAASPNKRAACIANPSAQPLPSLWAPTSTERNGAAAHGARGARPWAHTVSRGKAVSTHGVTRQG
eukprot:1071081-Prymnesium_polylepis.1